MKLAVAVLCAMSLVQAEQQAPVVLCGRELANARVLVCYGAEYVAKRASPQALLAALDGDKWIGQLMWGGRRGAISADWSRYKRGGPRRRMLPQALHHRCHNELLLNYHS
ncbi:unnamed protein product [Leptosia nina]|uniref:Uncharacterized protein n=1 Tax=Leptosia nina TaxID=320188 RepID=A0AAV1J9L9_9NEOP